MVIWTVLDQCGLILDCSGGHGLIALQLSLMFLIAGIPGHSTLHRHPLHHFDCYFQLELRIKKQNDAQAPLILVV
jgi:hypothetical protein